jgi:uncharacterized protein (DUF952 family)
MTWKKIILHCMKKQTWEKIRFNDFHSDLSIESCGFIHCSDPQNFWRVIHHFKDIQEDLVLLIIDPSLLRSPVKWEDLDKCGRNYPHIYGKLNLDAVIDCILLQRNKKDDFFISENENKYSIRLT